MKFYVEVLHPHEDRVLWHYYVEARDKEAAEMAVQKQVVADHQDGFLLETGGLFSLTVEEHRDETTGA